MATLFKFFEEGEPLNQSMEQLSFKYGHVRQGKTGVIDYALELYIDHAQSNNIPLNDVDAFFHWVDAQYDPIAAKSNFRSAAWGNILTDTLLRRE